jgi:hydroxyacyl-ACP dehydratase HTD2-like protein with hotdog domain
LFITGSGIFADLSLSLFSDLVIAGPLTAYKLIEFLRSHLLSTNKQAHIKSIAWRASSPLFVSQEIHLGGRWIKGGPNEGGTVEVWASPDNKSIGTIATAVVEV